MRRIVTLVLAMLIGGYSAAQAQTQMEMETAAEMEMDARDFLGLEWGAGIGVMGAFGGGAVVEKASIIVIGEDENEKKIVYVEEEGDLRPQLFLEMHVFLWGNKVREWRKYQRWKAADQMAQVGKIETARDKTTSSLKMPDPPLIGVGPFIALQSSGEDVVDALALGVMWGFRKDPKGAASVNVGLGLSFDPSVQVLAKDFKEGNAPPNGETEVRFKKEGRFGWALMTSFTF